MKTLRIDHVTVVTPDAERAGATFERIFALARTRPAGSRALAVGDARIDFVTPAAGTTLGTALAANGEGMAALCLEVADLDAAAAQLRGAGVAFATSDAGARRSLEVDPAGSHGVRLTLVQRP